MKMDLWRQPMSQTTAMRVVGAAGALPEHRYPQAELTQALKDLWGKRLRKPELLDQLHANSKIDFRHLAYAKERYGQFANWGEMNKAWLKAAEELGALALDRALDQAGLRRDQLDALYVVSITGIASPSLDARLINRMGLRPDIKRTPIFGVGCVGGALGLTRAADHTLAYPGQTAAIVSVELCSLTLQLNDLTTANMVSTGLFGDGAAAVIVAGADHHAAQAATKAAGMGRRGPEILGTASTFYPDSEHIMGWDISGDGFKVVLSAQLPDFIRANLPRDVDAFLTRHGLKRADIGNWVIHTGGPKVLEAFQDALALDATTLAASWDCLRQVGNLSSTSVLLVLEDYINNRRPVAGTLGVLMAMGPGFCSELILLRW